MRLPTPAFRLLVSRGRLAPLASWLPCWAKLPRSPCLSFYPISRVPVQMDKKVSGPGMLERSSVELVSAGVSTDIAGVFFLPTAFLGNAAV